MKKRRMAAWKITGPIVLLMLALVAAGCKSGGGRDDPILRLSAEEALTNGKELMAAGKYAQARDYLTHAFEVEPNSATGREALLLSADALFLDGGPENYIRAEAKYRDFQNRFPTSERSAYVQFQIANSLAHRVRRPDRDQSATREALAAFQELLRLYPSSEYLGEAEETIIDLRNRLAEHEVAVGRFNLRIRVPRAAVQRLETVLEQYPDYREIDLVLFFLGRAYVSAAEPDKAAETFERLRTEYPESPWVAKIPVPKDKA